MSDVSQLPAFLDPLLDFLYERLPPELYSFVTLLLSRSLALFTALASLASSLFAQWDAQSIILPLISFLAAYLALVSLYRITRWIFRATFWFIKWGTILSILAAGAGWYMGNQGVGVDGRDLVANLGTILLGALNGDGHDGAGARIPQAMPHTSNHRRKLWESFQNEWQYREGDQAEARDSDAQRIMSEIVAAGNRLLMEGGWWDAAKSIFTSSDSQGGNEGRSTKRQSNRSSRR